MKMIELHVTGYQGRPSTDSHDATSPFNFTLPFLSPFCPFCFLTGVQGITPGKCWGTSAV